MRGVKVRIVDDDGRDLPVGEAGEIVSMGPQLFTGYLDPTHDDAAASRAIPQPVAAPGAVEPPNSDEPGRP